MEDLFAKEKSEPARKTDTPSKVDHPLAERIRPIDLEEFVGQDHLLGEGKPLRVAIEQDRIGSMIFWGPPGSGKTTLAWIIARRTKAHFIPFSAVTTGIKEIKAIMVDVEKREQLYHQRTILFIDEIHRFNKAQQDAFLPYVEKGTVILIGATTENPSFEVNAPLLSRCRVFVLNPLSLENIKLLLKRAIADRVRGIGFYRIEFTDEVLSYIAQIASGDARTAFNALEFISMTIYPKNKSTIKVDLGLAKEILQKKAFLYDKAGEEHYNLISALHKSLRDSDPDAALYWLARMLAAGEDPLYVARRMVRFASEDIGNADPQALSITIAAKEAYHFLGSPEGELALAQACIYLATAPKSNAVYAALNLVTEDLKEMESQPVPLIIRKAPTKLMKSIGYGAGYQYAHDNPDHFADQQHLPENLRGRKYYHPTDTGFEKEIKTRLQHWQKLRDEWRAKIDKNQS